MPGGLAAVGGAWTAPPEVLGDRRGLLGAGSGDKGKKTKKKKKNRKVGRGSSSLAVDSISDVAGDYVLPPDEDFSSIDDVTGDYVAPPDRDFGDAGKRLLGAGSGDKGKKTKKKKKNRKVGRGSSSLAVDSISDVAGDYVLPPDEDFSSIDDVTGDYVAPPDRDFEGLALKSDASFAGAASEMFDRVLRYAASTDKEYDDDGFLACLRKILKRQETEEGFEWDYTC